MTTATDPRTLTAAGVRADLHADHAAAKASAEKDGDGPDSLEEAMHHEAFFILDRYSRSEGWNTSAAQIADIHEELWAVGIAAARDAMIELAAVRLAGTRRTTKSEDRADCIETIRECLVEKTADATAEALARLDRLGVSEDEMAGFNKARLLDALAFGAEHPDAPREAREPVTA